MIFDPYPPTVCSFLLLSVGKFGKFLTPPPLRHADVLNGWSLSQIGSILMISDLYDPETFLYTFTLGPCLICFFKFLSLTQLNKLL